MVDREALLSSSPQSVRASGHRSNSYSSSRVWLSGARCSPLRLPLAVTFTIGLAARRVTRYYRARPGLLEAPWKEAARKVKRRLARYFSSVRLHGDGV